MMMPPASAFQNRTHGVEKIGPNRRPAMRADPFPGFELGPELAEVVDGAIGPCDLHAPKVALIHRD